MEHLYNEALMKAHRVRLSMSWNIYLRIICFMQRHSFLFRLCAGASTGSNRKGDADKISRLAKKRICEAEKLEISADTYAVLSKTVSAVKINFAIARKLK